MRSLLCSGLSLFLSVAVSSAVLADPPEDLAAGQAALTQGDLAAALPLLKSAAEGLPASVEAQLALAECHLRLGQLAPALAQYRAVLRLSPRHAQAGQIVAALTGQQTDAQGTLARARTLMLLGSYQEAANLMKSLIARPIEESERTAARLLKAEAQLWNGAGGDTAALALQVARESQDPAAVGTARVIAALSLVFEKNAVPAEVRRLIAQAGDVPEPWQQRASLADVLLNLQDSEAPANVSGQLAAPLRQLPIGPFRSQIIKRASQTLIAAALEELGRGERQAAMQIAWPMLSDQPLPDGQQVLQQVTVEGGWIPNTTEAAALYFQASRILANASRSEYVQDRSKTSLLGYWLATEAHRQSSAKDATKHRLDIAAELAGLSRPAPTRKPGELLSAADEMQRQLLLALASRVSLEQQRDTIVTHVLAQIQRYQAAQDLETGLNQFVVIDDDAGPGDARLVMPLDQLPSGSAQHKLLLEIGKRYAQQGQHHFNRDTATLAHDANEKLQPADQTALRFFSRVLAAYPTDGTPRTLADGITQRYVTVEHWGAAYQALSLLYADQPEGPGRWADIHLRIRHATHIEDRLLATGRRLPNELSQPLQESLAAIVSILEDRPDEATRQTAIGLGAQAVSRYASLERGDLVEAVITALTPESVSQRMADWALWMRITVLERQAARSVAAAAAESNGDSLSLDPAHKQELELLHELIAQHPRSTYRTEVVNRIEHIAATYQRARSFETATTVITDFLATGQLSSDERLRYRVVQIAMVKANQVFSERPDSDQPPAAMIAEHGDAIKALAGYLQDYPVGSFASAAEQELFQIARVYGSAGAWSVAREVIDQFGTIVSDYRRPAHLRLVRAATYLGELDPTYGLALLSPAVPTSGPVGIDGGLLAMNPGSYEADDAEEEGAGAPGDPFGGLARAGGGRSSADQSGGDAGSAGGAGGLGGGGFGGALQPGASSPQPVPEAPAVNAPFGDAPPAEYRPNDTALAMIRQSQQRQFQQLAMLDQQQESGQQKVPSQAAQQSIALPTGSVLSEAEMKRQDEAADAAYAILIEIVKTSAAGDSGTSQQARNQILWLFGFFEGQLRANRAIVLIQRFLTDQPQDSAKVALSYQAINDQLVWAAQRQPADRINLVWLDKRHEAFELARKQIGKFAADFSDEKIWVHRARMLMVESYRQEANMATPVSVVRAGGLLVRSAEAITSLLTESPEHPETANFPQKIWQIADALGNLQQRDQAIYVLGQIPIYFPANALAHQSLLRIAQLHAASLANPLKAVETYQEFLSLNGDNESVRTEIFNIAQQLAARQRYLESLHVFGVFVESFPTDARAPEALRVIGQTHQSNEAWDAAIATYQRLLEEYPQVAQVPQVKLAVAECQINLSKWREARRLYDEFVQQYPKDKMVATAQQRATVLKGLDRYQSLLEDEQIERNKDDAQFQIGRLVRNQLANPVKAVEEFGKVVKDFPKSDLADDAQLEVGKALLDLGRTGEAREALFQVAAQFPNSPLADDALHLIAQSYEGQAQRLASVTLESARKEAFRQSQRLAFQNFNEQNDRDLEKAASRRGQLKAEGKDVQLALDEASQAYRLNGLAVDALSNTARQAELQAETQSAMQVANRQDRINESYREAVKLYVQVATEYPLGDKTDDSLLRVAQIFEGQLKDRAAAMETYQKIVKLFPGTPVAEDAAWKVALFHQQEGKFTASADALREFIRNYPASNRVADAQFALAEVLEELGQWVDAMDAYETFRQKFAQHPKATVAQDQINWIKTYRK